MKKLFPITAMLFAAAIAPAFAAGPPPAQPQGQPQGLPAPKILVIDRAAILQMSKVGQDVGKQIQTYGDQAKAQLAGQQRALQAEGQALQQQIAILAPDAKQKKIAAFEAKQSSLQISAQRKEQDIQAGFMAARQAIEKQLGPILQGLMQQRGANMILDKNAVVFATTGIFDITQPAIDQLNQKLPGFKVQLGGGAPAAAMPAKK